MNGHLDRPTVFIAGSRGMLACDLIAELTCRTISTAGADLPELDITNPASVATTLARIQPSVVVNCAAYTAVDKAETDRDTAFQVNGIGPGILADACAERGIPLIHISTDFVFNGALDRPYREDDEPHPLSVYGMSKLAGEKSVVDAGGNYFIIRTSWLYGIHGANFPKTMLRLAREREELRVVSDQHGCPTWSVDLSRAIADMISHITSGMADDIWGVYHFCNNGQTTWYGFAEAVIAEANHYEELKVGQIIPIPTEEYPTPAMRPKWSVLDTGKITATFGITPPFWETSARRMIGELYRRTTAAH